MSKVYTIQCRLVVMHDDEELVETIERHVRLVAATAASMGVKGGLRIDHSDREHCEDQEEEEQEERESCRLLVEGLRPDQIRDFDADDRGEDENPLSNMIAAARARIGVN